MQGCTSTSRLFVGTELSLQFTVFDSQMPPRSTSVKRYLRIVSPCLANEFFCSDLSQTCGTSTCEVRARLLAESDTSSDEFFFLRFHDNVLPRTVKRVGDVSILDVFVPCGRPSPVPLAFCLGPATGCGVYLEENGAQSLRLASRLVLPSTATAAGQVRDVCAPKFLQGGSCAHGEHWIRYQAFQGERNASDVVSIHVHIGERLVHATPIVSLSLSSSAILSSPDVKEIEAALSSGNSMTNSLLEAAADLLATAIGTCAWHVLHPLYRGAGANATHVLASFTEAPAIATEVNTTSNSTEVQVCLQASNFNS